MKYVVTCLIFFLNYSSIAQKDTIYSLLVKEYFKDSTGQSCSRINQYDFSKGIYFSKKEINFNERDHYSSLNSYFIHENRFLIVDDGTVFDLKKEKYITYRKGNFICVKGDSVIIEFEKYYYFSLKKKKYFSINDSIYDYFDRDLSPDLTKRIDIIYGKDSNKLALTYNNGKSQILVNSIGHAQFKSKGGSELHRYAVKWIDDSTFVFADYHFYNEHDIDYNFIHLYKMNTTDKFPVLIGKIDSIRRSRENSKFNIDPVGNLIFHCKKGEFLVDINQKTLKLNDFICYGNGFKASHQQILTEKNLFYNQQLISSNWTTPYEVKTHLGYIAVDNFSDLSYNPEFKVSIWNRFTNSWMEIELPSNFELVGWFTHF